MRSSIPTALLVFTGCLLGAAIDTWMQFPIAQAAALFPPYAVLTAALILAPARRWWLLLLAASLGSFLPHLAGARPGFVASTESANYLRALVAAIGVRWLDERRGRLETLRGMLVLLLFAVGVAPCAAAFLGSGLMISHGRSHDFWLGWKEWFLSNALTGLTLLPIFLVSFHRRHARLSAARALEAMALSLGLAAVGLAVFTTSYRAGGALPAHLYWPLPFLLWAAVRFDPGVTGAALLGVATMAIWGTLHGRGPFATEAPTDKLLQLQLFLIAMALPLLLLSSLMEEQRRTASALRESREQYRSIVEDPNELICRFLPDGNASFVNGAFCRHVARPPGDLIGQRVWSFFSAGEERAIQEQIATIDPGRPHATHEVSAPTPEGALRWRQWRHRGLYDERGRLVEFQSIGRDITERKQAEEERGRLAAREQVELALRDANRRKDEFLAMLGHEQRNQLAPIGIALEMIRRTPPDSAQSKRAQEVIARQASHMTRLVDDLLDLSRITYGKLQLQLETVDLSVVMAQAVENSRPFLESKRHELTVSLPEGKLPVRGDPTRLAQIAANLLNNAIKYTEPGGHIGVSLERRADRARLVVRDDGIGIAPEMLASIFDLFTQVSGRRAQGGLGIGLTLVKRLVELHGGTVDAHSAGLGHGSQMIVQVPVEVDLREAPRLQDARSVSG